jgi:exoribonuclease R
VVDQFERCVVHPLLRCDCLISVTLPGRERINRALDGDIVAVEILTTEEMEREKKIQTHPSEMDQDSVVVAEETAVPTAADLEGLQKQPSGGNPSLLE